MTKTDKQLIDEYLSPDRPEGDYVRNRAAIRRMVSVAAIRPSSGISHRTEDWPAFEAMLNDPQLKD